MILPPSADYYSPEHVFLSPYTSNEAKEHGLHAVVASQAANVAVLSLVREAFRHSQMLRRLEAMALDGLVIATALRFASKREPYFAAAKDAQPYAFARIPRDIRRGTTKAQIADYYPGRVIDVTVTGLVSSRNPQFGAAAAVGFMRFGRLIPEPDATGSEMTRIRDLLDEVAEEAQLQYPDVISTVEPRSASAPTGSWAILGRGSPPSLY